MREIKLTQGYVSQVDDWNYDRLMEYKWHIRKHRNTYYATASVKIDGKKTTINMHRVIMGALKGVLVDHKDRNGLHNEEENLRECTPSQNGANCRAVGRSKYLGVTYITQNGHSYIVAKICKNYKVKHLGIHLTEELAALAYDVAAKKYHGEFANLNFG